MVNITLCENFLRNYNDCDVFFYLPISRAHKFYQEVVKLVLLQHSWVGWGHRLAVSDIFQTCLTGAHDFISLMVRPRLK